MTEDELQRVVADDEDDNEDGFLYHYTSLEAFNSIVANKTIWATHIQYLNDTSEQAVLRDMVSMIPDGFKSKEQWLDLLSEKFEPLYVVCFSEDRGDSLSQWRAYGGASGVCLKFDKTQFIKYCESKENAAALSKVVYINPKVRRKNRDVLIDDFGDEMIPIMHDAIIRPDGEIRVSHLFAMVAATIKHSAFLEEKEWRMLFTKGSRVLKHRARGSLLVPYVEQGFGEILKASLSEVIVGPSTHKEQTAEAIRGMLAEEFPSVEVRSSDTPYRGF